MWDARAIYPLAITSWRVWTDLYGQVVESIHIDFLRFECELTHQHEHWLRYDQVVRGLTVFDGPTGLTLGELLPGFEQRHPERLADVEFWADDVGVVTWDTWGAQVD